MTKVVNLSRTIFFEVCACLEMCLEMFLFIYLFIFFKVICIVSLIYLYSVSVHFFSWHFILDFDDLATTLSLSVSVVTVSGSQDNPRLFLCWIAALRSETNVSTAVSRQSRGEHVARI